MGERHKGGEGVELMKNILSAVGVSFIYAGLGLGIILLSIIIGYSEFYLFEKLALIA